MPNCPNSPWVIAAQQYLTSNQQNRNEIYYTVEYLLNDHCGIGYRTSIEDILQYLSTMQFNLDRELFQHTVLVPLKQLGIVATLVNPGTQGGVFIPCNNDDIEQVAIQVLNRVNSELVNLSMIAQHHNILQNQIDNIQHDVEQVRDSI